MTPQDRDSCARVWAGKEGGGQKEGVKLKYSLKLSSAVVVFNLFRDGD